MPQALGSSGGQTGIGTMLVARAGFTAVALVWAEATAPVKARATARVRMAIFIVLRTSIQLKIFLDLPDVERVSWEHC